MVLAFLLGITVALLRSDFRMPEPLHAALTIYLLFAIGLKGGAKLEGIAPAEFAGPALAALGLCVAIPVWCFFLLRRVGRLDVTNAAAVAAHYGSVSVVTFGAGLAFLDNRGVAHEPYLPALLALMEVPGILVALALARGAGGPMVAPARSAAALGIVPAPAGAGVLRDLLTGKGVVLLLGGLVIGLASGHQGFDQVAPLFDAPFRGVLTLFLLEAGIVAGQRLRDLRSVGPFLGAFALLLPLLHGLLGVTLGWAVGLGLGGATMLGILAASASYIAAPAAVRMALPSANPALYLTASLGITFPFNVIAGIPLYHAFARWLFATG
jgi:hypothetical protein